MVQCGIINQSVYFQHDVNERINDKIREFVEKNGAAHAHWNKRRQSHRSCDNDLSGKKGEVIVAHCQGLPLEAVDWTIYEPRQKHFGADLQVGDVRHVKTCTDFTVEYLRTHHRRGADLSWTFQYQDHNNETGVDELFTNHEHDNELCAFVYVPEWYSDRGRLVAILPWGEVRELLENPADEKKRGEKLCLYYKELERVYQNKAVVQPQAA